MRTTIVEKSLGTLEYFRAFSNSHGPNPSSHPTNNVGREYQEFFSEFQLCIGWGEGELQENFKKETLFNEGTQKLQEVLNIALLSQGLFVHDCSFY